uniref:MFS domain-containing protein n=1 Tax=Angiostrongylus cantonensis TaxID=6313 RepID=A0A0K0DM39_ANGCA
MPAQPWFIFRVAVSQKPGPDQTVYQEVYEVVAVSAFWYKAESTMEGIALLTVLSCSMFLGSYFAGSIPMMFNMSESRMRMVSIFGAGLLLGTALSVIIPEGVESLYSGVAERNLRHLRERNNRVKSEETLVNSKTEKEESPAIISRAFVDKNRDGDSGNFIVHLYTSSGDRSGRNRMGISATIGLVVHAAGM